MHWKEVIGQQETIERLRALADSDRVPHALLLCGQEGAGKMALAMAFAKYLLSSRNPSPNAEAMLREWAHPDLHFSYPTIKLPSMSGEHQPVSDDFSSEWHQMIMQGPYFSLQQWMGAMGATTQQAIITGAESDELTRKLSLKASQGGYKVAVIWLPERMNLTSANKILKLLEEPPQRTVFIMVANQPDKLLETIRSRTQRIDVKPIAYNDMVEALITRRGIDQQTAKHIAHTAKGNWLKAIESLDAGSENKQFLDMFILLMRMAYSRNVAQLKKWSETAAALGREKSRRMLVYFLQMVRENFMYNFKMPELSYMTEEEEAFSRKFSPFINENNVVEMSELIERTNRDIGQNANAKIQFYDFALNMIVLLLRK